MKPGALLVGKQALLRACPSCDGRFFRPMLEVPDIKL